jgi:hypothetical protein
MHVKYRHSGGGEPSPEQTEKRPPVLVHPRNRPSIILIDALSIILITLNLAEAYHAAGRTAKAIDMQEANLKLAIPSEPSSREP